LRGGSSSSLRSAFWAGVVASWASSIQIRRGRRGVVARLVSRVWICLMVIEDFSAKTWMSSARGVSTD